MSEQTEQLTHAQLAELARRDPEAVEHARRAGQLSDLMAGRIRCPHCGEYAN